MDNFIKWLLGFWSTVCNFCKKHKVFVVVILTVFLVLFFVGLVSCQGLNVLEGIEGQVVVTSPVDIM